VIRSLFTHTGTAGDGGNGRGGGVAAGDSSLTFANVTIASNSVEGGTGGAPGGSGGVGGNAQGGGLYGRDSSVELRNDGIASNDVAGGPTQENWKPWDGSAIRSVPNLVRILYAGPEATT
jgi:hypothetical protein